MSCIAGACLGPCLKFLVFNELKTKNFRHGPRPGPRHVQPDFFNTGGRSVPVDLAYLKL